MITIESKTNIIKIGDPINNKVNIFTNFKAYQIADMIDKLPYTKVNRVMEIDDKQYGLAVEFKADFFTTLIEELPNILYEYEHQGNLG